MGHSDEDGESAERQPKLVRQNCVVVDIPVTSESVGVHVLGQTRQTECSSVVDGHGLWYEFEIHDLGIVGQFWRPVARIAMGRLGTAGR